MPSSDTDKLAAQCFAHANDALRQGQYQYAIQLYRRCCAYRPESLLFRQALRGTARRHYHRKKGAWLARIRGLWDKARARRAQLQGDDHQVLEACEDALLRHPWDQRVLLEQARACARLGYHDIAIWNLETVLQLAPEHLAALRELAVAYEVRGFSDKAAQMWERIHRLQPSNVEAYRQWRELEVRAGIRQLGYEPDQLPDSEQDLELTAKVRLVRPEAKSDRPVTTHSTVDELRARIERDPANAAHYLLLAEEYCRMGRLSEAGQVLEQAMQVSGGDVRVRERWEDLQALVLSLRAAQAYERLRKQPDSAQLQRQLQTLRTELNDYELEVFRRRSERYPDRGDLKYEFGLRLAQAGLLDEAILQLTAATEDYYHRLPALVALGQCYEVQKDQTRAQQSYQQAVKAAPTDQSGPVQIARQRLSVLTKTQGSEPLE